MLELNKAIEDIKKNNGNVIDKSKVKDVIKNINK